MEGMRWVIESMSIGYWRLCNHAHGKFIQPPVAKKENVEAFGIKLLHAAHDTNGDNMVPKGGLYMECTKLQGSLCSIPIAYLYGFVERW